MKIIDIKTLYFELIKSQKIKNTNSNIFKQK